MKMDRRVPSFRQKCARYVHQKGAALLIMMLIMVLGTSWALVGAVNEASRNTVREQAKTGEALRLAKNALLGYVAQEALTNDIPGRLPCPEALGSVGSSAEGTPDSTVGCSTLTKIGRFPWKTLGIDKPLDGAGEALWYVVGSSVRAIPINYALTGSLTLDGTANAAVAVIIAPGVALNTASASASAPSPCVKRDQSTGRSSSPLNPSDFIECWNATPIVFASSRSDTWGNDRVISITAAEVLSAIEGAVADRIQRFVAPILNGVPTSALDWYQNKSLSEWGVRFFPYASTWTDPTSNDSCGNYGVTEGLLPLASGEVAVGTGCSARWTTGTISRLSGSGTFFNLGCSADAVRMRCSIFYSGTPVVRVTTTASNIAMGFRTRPTTGEITFNSAAGSTVTSLTPSIVTASGAGQVVVQATMANKTGFGGTGAIDIPHPEDSILVNTNTGSNPDLAWFINNQWQRYTYYAISPAVTANPSGTCCPKILGATCISVNVTNCLTLTNAEAGSGNTNDKRIALVLSGRPLTGMTQPSSNRNAYFEAQNDQTSTLGDRNFQRGTISTTFNDRPTVCPIQKQTTASANVLCD